MRGGSLSHPEAVEALRPFIVACWNGRSVAEMPPEVREAWDAARPGGRNISCMVLDPAGRLVRAFWPLPGLGGPGPRGPGDPLGRETLGRFMKEQIEEAGARLSRPASTRTGLKLPTPDGPGVRLFLTLRRGERAVGNYKAPTVEAVTTTAAERRALAFPERAREVDPASLRRWLEQLYPPAIMDSSGTPPSVEGELRLRPAGEDGGRRFAILAGELRLRLDDRAATRYGGRLEAVVAYDASGPDLKSFRGVFEGMYPKSDPRNARPQEYRMIGVFESVPE